MARDYATTIAALLANAENEGNSEEARQAYRNKAEAMMREYRIAEEDAIATDPGSALPIMKVMAFVDVHDSLAREWYPRILLILANHAEVKVKIGWAYVGIGYRITPSVVGYAGDVRYFEFLWTAAHLMFSTRITPRWDSSRSEADNIFLMRQAGIERRAIADAAWGWGAGQEAKSRSKVQAIYKREAIRRGEPILAAGLGFNAAQYREAYAQQFFTTLHSRLWHTRQAANAANGQVTLAGRAERVLEAFYTHFPELRPTPRKFTDKYVDPREGCERCAKAASGCCREHNYLRPREISKTDRERRDRAANSSSARAGQMSGRTAAEGVHLERGGVVPTMEKATTRELS